MSANISDFFTRHGRRGLESVLSLLVFGLSISAQANDANVRNISFSPINAQPGQVVNVTWTYDQSAGQQSNAAILFSNVCSVQPRGTAGQTIPLGDGCANDVDDVGGGCLTNAGGLTSTTFTVTKPITIPAGLTVGTTYQIVIAMRNGVFINTGGSAIDTFGCQPWTYVLNGAKVQVLKSVNRVHVAAGDNLTYNLFATNIGDTTATNVVVQDTLPPGINTTPISETFSTAPSATTAGPPRRWTFASLPSGASVSITMVVQTLTGQPFGATMYTNFATAYSATDPAPYTPTAQPAVSFSFNQATGCWVSYAVWDADPYVNGAYSSSPGDGLDFNEGNLHVYSLMNGTTVTLGYSTSEDSAINPMHIDAAEPTAPFPGAQLLNAGRNLQCGPFKSRFHKLTTSYPVTWEYDSNAVIDRLGRSMFVYSVEAKYCDNKPFYTYLDYDHKTGCGIPDCPAGHVGDALHIFNPSISQPALFSVYQSPNANGGANWSLIGNYSVMPDSVLLIGGATQAGTIPYGDYLVVPYGPDPTTPAQPIILAKGNADCLANAGYINDGGCMYGTTPGGQRIADGTGANDRLFGLIPASGHIVITALSGAPSVTVQKYTATSGQTIEGGFNPEWPISGNIGTWAVVMGATAVTPGFPGTPVTYNGGAGYYRVLVTGGSVEAAFGGRLFDWSNQGDGDFVPATDNPGALGFGTPNLLYGKDFWVSSGLSNHGGIDIIMPVSGTAVNMPNNMYTVGNSPFLGQNSTFGPSWPAPYADTAWRYLMANSNQNYHITSNKNIYVVVQNEDHDHVNKCFAPPPPTILPPDFNLVKSDDRGGACYTIGDTITYCIAYANNQNCDVSNFQVWDTLSASLQFLAADNGGVLVGNTVVWTLPFVPANATGTLCFWAVVKGYSQAPASDAATLLAWMPDLDVDRWLWDKRRR